MPICTKCRKELPKSEFDMVCHVVGECQSMWLNEVCNSCDPQSGWPPMPYRSIMVPIDPVVEDESRCKSCVIL